MAYTIPQITLSTAPSKYSPVYAPNWFAFTASAGSASDINLITNINILKQEYQVPTLLENAGRFKLPIRYGNTFVFNPEQVLKSYVTYPYNNGDKVYYGSGEAIYVNEVAGFGSRWTGGVTSSFPTVAPEQDGIVKYNLNYGLEYNPGITFSTIITATSSTYSVYFIQGVKMFAQVGDSINIAVNSGLFSYYNGATTILDIFNDGFATYVKTPQSGGPIATSIPGYITAVTHIYGTSSAYYAYNGTRQYNEKDVNFDNVYCLRYFDYGEPTPLFPSTSTASNFKFMNDYGYDSNHCIPIRPGQNERARFITDFYDPSYVLPGILGLRYTMTTYNTSGATVSSVTYPIIINPSGIPGTPYAFKCWTVQLFTANSSIIDGYKYKFTLDRQGLGKIDIWYIGYDKCSKYTNYRIKFLNKQGSWSYWNFNMDNKQTTTIARKEYKTPFQYDQTFNTITPGGFAGASSPYTLNKSRGNSVLSISAVDTFTLNSDWVTDEQLAYLQQLITSPQVFIFYDTYTLSDNTQLTGVNIPIMITDTSYVYKTINRDKIFNLTINYKMAFDQSLQNP